MASTKLMRLKECMNNTFNTEEILWLLHGHEDMSAFDFVCKMILNVEPEKIFSCFEYLEHKEDINQMPF